MTNITKQILAYGMLKLLDSAYPEKKQRKPKTAEQKAATLRKKKERKDKRRFK